VKRPDRKELSVLSALLLALCAAGCSSINTSVPISPMMFMQNRPATPAPAAPAGPALAAHDSPAAGD
jgi:hypothetical protein